MKTKKLVIVPVFTALTIICSYIQIPIGTVPISLQTLMVVLSGIILKSKLGALSQGLYIILGLIGLPVFAGGASGMSFIYSPTFGFIIGFILASFLAGKIIESSINNFKMKILIASMVGIFSVYIIGVPYFLMIFHYVLLKPIGLNDVLKLSFIPFVLGDIIKIIISSSISYELLKIPYIKNFLS